MKAAQLNERYHGASDGHPWFDYDAEKAGRLLRRCQKIGRAVPIRVSPDLFHMLAAGHRPVGELGYELICDPALPLDSVEA